MHVPRVCRHSTGTTEFTIKGMVRASVQALVKAQGSCSFKAPERKRQNAASIAAYSDDSDDDAGCGVADDDDDSDGCLADPCFRIITAEVNYNLQFHDDYCHI